VVFFKGKNSKTGRIDRILQELEKHMRTKVSANKVGLNLDYLPVMKERLTKPLIKNGAEGVEKVMEMMDEYYITRDDFDSIVELSSWPGQVDIMSKIDSKVKAAFTRAYNKKTHKNPFVAVDFKKLKSKAQADGEYGEEEGGGVEEEVNDDDDVEKDTMIKAVRKNQTKAATVTKKAGAKATATKAATSKTSTKASTKRAAPSEGSKIPASKKKKT
jgi:replication factor C subunit 1